LADLMAFGREEALWGPQELGAILQHQLDAEVAFDLSRLGQVRVQEVERALASIQGSPIRTFRELFEHPSPPIELVDLSRRFAKACRSSRDGPLPNEIATVLYFASIVVAMITCGRRISKLDDEAIGYALDWALDQPWLDESIRGLISRGRQAVKPAGPEDDV
jgi:hypothetical protein